MLAFAGARINSWPALYRTLDRCEQRSAIAATSAAVFAGRLFIERFAKFMRLLQRRRRIFVPNEEEGVSETNDDDGSSEASSDDGSEHVDSDPDVANAEDGLLDVTAIMDKIVKIHEEASELMEVAQFGPPREPGLYTMESTVFNAETVIHRRRRGIDNGKPINTGHRKQYLMGHLYTYVVLGVGLAPSHGTIRHGTEERGICTRSQMMVVQHLHL